jgi:hypothetical protein
MTLTAEGRQKLAERPPSARNTINCVLDLETLASPQHMVKMAWRIHPVTHIRRAPTTSATEPQSSNVHPHTK